MMIDRIVEADKTKGSIMKMAEEEKQKYVRQWKAGYQPSLCARYLAGFIHGLADSGDSLLEIGCGDGSVTHQLCSLGHRCVGTDITLSAVHSGRQFMEAPAWDLPFKDNQFDTTFSSDVLEHIPTEMVLFSIKEILRVTRKRTVHVIATFPHSVDGVDLHLSVHPIAWWQELFCKENVDGKEVIVMDRQDFLKRVGDKTWG